MLSALMPKSAPFFEMLLQQNELLRRMVSLLVETLENVHLEDDAHRDSSTLEEEGDILYGQIIRALADTFITPIDREDLLRICQQQEEAMDNLRGLSIRLHIFEFHRVRFPALRMARTLSAMLELSRLMLEGLSRKQDCHKTRAFRTLKDECDMILAVGLAELMDEQQELTPVAIVQMLKWSQTYERMSIILDDIIKLAETIEEAVVKNV